MFGARVGILYCIKLRFLYIGVFRLEEKRDVQVRRRCVCLLRGGLKKNLKECFGMLRSWWLSKYIRKVK